jgi:hypothetical protein
MRSRHSFVRKFITGVIGAFCVCASANDLAPDVVLTARALNTNRKLITHLPLYTCLETITRNQPGKKKSNAARQDVVQVDVGVGTTEEMYSWPGDASFSPKDLPSLVGHGMLSTGLFHTFVENIFGAGQGIVKTAGAANMDGITALHFTYTVPSLESKWAVNWLGAKGAVGQQGEFWVDPSTLTLLQMDTTAVDIPYTLPLQSLSVSMRYRVQPNGEEEVLLPQSAHVEAIERNGIRHYEQVEFSHCHVFAAESGLSNATQDLTQTLTRYEQQRGILPAGLVLQLDLDTVVQPGEATVGKSIYAVLRDPVKLQGQPEIPHGAIVKGHVREFLKMQDPPNTFIVGLEFDELTWAGRSVAFLANMTSVQPIEGIEFALFKGQSRTVDTAAGRGSISLTTRTWAAAIPGVANFFLQGRGRNLPKGLRMTWRTAEMAHR